MNRFISHGCNQVPSHTHELFWVLESYNCSVYCQDCPVGLPGLWDCLGCPDYLLDCQDGFRIAWIAWIASGLSDCLIAI